MKNNGPQACDWVSLLQDKADGTEMVSGSVMKSLRSGGEQLVKDEQKELNAALLQRERISRGALTLPCWKE